MIKTLSYAGKNLAEFSMFFDSSKIYKKPSKQFSGYDIPGRNGRLYRSNNKFSNVIIEYQCYFRENFGENFTALINYLNSFDTYQRLEDTTDPSVYRMALFHAEVAPQTGAFLENGKFTLSFDCKPQEYYADGAEFERIASHYDTYTGDPAVLVNEGESTVTNLKVALEPIQTGSGDPSPTNIRPITGHTSASVTRTGKNLLPRPYHDSNNRTDNGITYTVALDGSVTANGTATANSTFYLTRSLTYANYPNTMTVNGNPRQNNRTFIRVQRVTTPYNVLVDDYGNGGNFTIPDDGNMYQCIIRIESGQTVNNLTFKPMVRLASDTDPTYEPYQGNTYTIDLNGTRYGGTVDLATGVLTVTHVYGETTWGAMSDASTVGTVVRKRYSLGTTLSPRAGGSSNVAPYNSVAGDFDVDNGTRWFNDASNAFFYLPPSTPSTTSIQMVAQLATPQTVQLTAQQISLLTGTNYISSSGEVTVITRTPLILKNPSPMTSKPTFKFTNITAPFTVSANGETIISFQNAIRLIKHAVANNMTFDANGTALTVTKTGTPAYTETSILINSGYLPAGRYSFSSATLGTLAVKSADGTETYSSGGTFTLTEITQVKVWYTITPSASTPQTINMPIFLRPLGDLYVNSELMDCYMLDGDTAYSFNECVELPKDFLQLDERTVMTMTSGAVGFIAPNWWRL